MRTKEPYISVIIPTYNREAFIKDAIDSILSQKNHSYTVEIIVIDDGSTDSTKDVAKQYKEKITFVTIPHSGDPAVARNHGLHIARGTIVAFLDSDDIWRDTKLAEQIPLLDTPGVVLAYSQASVIDEHGKDIGRLVVNKADIHKGESLKGLLETNVISTSTVVAQKDILLAAGGFVEGKGLKGVEDYDLWLKIILRYPKGIKYIAKSLTFYRLHTTNVSTNDTTEALQQIINAHENTCLYTTDETQRKLVDEQLETDYRNLGGQLSAIHGKPSISVVMSVFNGEALLRPAIDSILSQTLQNYEFIIINDGSTDGTLDILKSYDDHRIRIINQENHGLVYSLNKACRIASSEFIARMDADDISAPSRLERELSVITANPSVALVGTYFSYIDEDANHLGVTIAMPTKDVDIKRSLYVVNPFAHGSTLIRKQAWREAGGYTSDYGPTEDYKLWSDIVKDGRWTMAIIPDTLYWYRINPNSISHQKGNMQHTFSNQIINERWQHPFIGKTIRAIIYDGNMYKRSQSVHAANVFDVYRHQQLVIMRRLFIDRHLLTGLKTAIGLGVLAPKWLPLIISRSVAGGFLRKMRFK